MEIIITIQEFVSPPAGGMCFFAKSDKKTNQQLAAYTPTGWGNDLLSALSGCIRTIEKFPYGANSPPAFAGYFSTGPELALRAALLL